ncbi:MAG: hypothetical protein KBD83_03360 [Gammaproteobacteria bacterium]|nr:hypothetical protein [Gammaproteobacteria bacterium]
MKIKPIFIAAAVCAVIFAQNTFAGNQSMAWCYSESQVKNNKYSNPNVYYCNESGSSKCWDEKTQVGSSCEKGEAICNSKQTLDSEYDDIGGRCDYS